MKFINRKISILFLGMFLIFLISSCEKEGPFTDSAETNFDTFGVDFSEGGAIVEWEITSSGGAAFNLSEGNAAAVSLTLIAQGEEQVNSADLICTFKGQTANVSSYTSFPAQVELKLSDMITLFNIPDGTLSAGDNFAFQIANVNTATANYDLSRTLNIGVLCLLPEDVFVGDYVMTYVDEGSLAFGASPMGPDGITVTMVSTGQTSRAFDFAWLDGAYGNSPVAFNIDFVCNVITGSCPSVGLTCDSASIGFGPSPTTYSVDLNDDSVITLGTMEWVPDGDCGVAPAEVIFTLTKVN